MKKLVLSMMALSLLAPVSFAQAKMSKKAAMKACKEEMPNASKKELKECVKTKKNS
jgi:Flp pilus assembly protein TadD